MDLCLHYQTLACDICPIYAFIDLRVESVENGIYRARVPLSANVQNHLKIFHAGPIWMAAEYLGGLIVLHNTDVKKYQPVVSGLDIKFIGPALSDIVSEVIFSYKEVDKMRKSLDLTGRYDFTTNIVVKDTNANLVAEAEGNYSVKDFSNLLGAN